MSNYANLLGRLKIQNSPPDGANTVRWWIEKASITNSDHILDLACSTGYSSRNIVLQTGASSVGVDLSNESIQSAHWFAERDQISEKCHFEIGDATCLRFADDSFSAVVVGSVFGFFANKEMALAECHRVIKPGGRLCVASFYFKSIPPDDLLNDVANQIGFRPNPVRCYQYWKRFFSDRFTIIHESQVELPILGEQELTLQVLTMLGNLPIEEQRIGSEAFNSVIDVRRNLNKLREYQGVGLWIYRK